MKILEIKNLFHKFFEKDEDGNIISEKSAVKDVSLDVEQGQFIAIIGHNGSGKSTLAKHINGILKPTSGTLFLNGKDCSKAENVWDIRQSAGMVFQNPDNQIIATVVEEDVGFGPENLGIPTEEIWQRVETALRSVGMLEHRHLSPTRLSGGQKQRVAIAGVLAMKPDCIVLDEPTAMLDPNGRKEVLETLHDLNRREKVTIILITHHMDEVIHADRVFVMNHGEVRLQGTPREIFSHYDILKEIGLDVPIVTELVHQLQENKIPIKENLLYKDEFVQALKEAYGEISCEASIIDKIQEETKKETKEETIMKLSGVNFIYSPDSIYRKQALTDVSLEIQKGEFLGIVGHTGSGKSTLIQLFNGLNKASSGNILFQGQDIYGKEYSLGSLRKKVGLVFQYPEHQLFEATVLEDVAFGPKNLGFSKKEAMEKAKQALSLMGMSESYYEMSPFELSGGEKRKVAIAGVIAMNPEMLVLDEPTAALDPKGRDEIFTILTKLHKEKQMTIVLVSHSMEDMARYAKRMIVMHKGKKIMEGTPQEVFSHREKLEQTGLAAPEITYLLEAVKDAGLAVNTRLLTVNEAAEALKNIWNGAKVC